MGKWEPPPEVRARILGTPVPEWAELVGGRRDGYRMPLKPGVDEIACPIAPPLEVATADDGTVGYAETVGEFTTLTYRRAGLTADGRAIRFVAER